MEKGIGIVVIIISILAIGSSSFSEAWELIAAFLKFIWAMTEGIFGLIFKLLSMLLS